MINNTNCTNPAHGEDWFVQQILQQYPVLSDSYERQAAIKYMYRGGWALADVIAYCACWEEVNPQLDEKIALTRMTNIREKYSNK